MRYLIGLGTYTAFDDSVGIRLIEYVVDHRLERGFRAIDLSGNLLDLVAYLTPETEALLLVDAARMGLAPGQFRFFSPAEVATQKRVDGLSTHEGDLLRVLELARQHGYPQPPMAIMGIEPLVVAPEIGLSVELMERLPRYVNESIGYLNRL